MAKAKSRYGAGGAKNGGNGGGSGGAANFKGVRKLIAKNPSRAPVARTASSKTAIPTIPNSGGGTPKPPKV